VTSFNDFSERAGRWCGDFVTLQPEGTASYGEKSKDGAGFFTAILAFVGIQGASLTIAEQFRVPPWIALALYAIFSVLALWLMGRLLTLTRDENGVQVHHFDKATVLYGKFAFYLAIISILGFGYGYIKDLFTPGKPVFVADVTVQTPQPITAHVARSKALANDALASGDSMSLEVFSQTLADGLKGKKDKGDVFVTWSAAPFDSDYGDFGLELFPEVPDSTQCLTFLYSAYPTRYGTIQYSLRQLYFRQDPKTRFLTRQIDVRAAKRHDLVVLVFWSSASDFDKNHPYALKNVSLAQ
jgi:hypothetical protein